MADDKVISSSLEIDYGYDSKSKRSQEIAPVEHVEGGDDDIKNDHMDYGRVDAEVAKYASEVAVAISPEENARLKRMVDKRVLSIMIFTYFLQALDKGTLSFTSIMGIKTDTHLVGQQVRISPFPQYWTLVFTNIVFLVDNLHLHRYSRR
jgi:hypothetical protein